MNASCAVPVEEEEDIFAFIVDGVLVGILSFGGLILNIFSFAVLWKKRRTSTTFFFVLFLAVADSLYLVHSALFQTFRSANLHKGALNGYQDIWPYMEPFEYPLGVMAHTASTWIITLMAIDRFIFTHFPFKAHRWCTTRKAGIELAVLIVFDISFNSAWFFRQKTVEEWDDCSNSTKPVIVAYGIGESRPSRLAHTVLYETLVFGLPLGCLCIFNVLFIKFLRNQSKVRERLTNSNILKTTKDSGTKGKSNDPKSKHMSYGLATQHRITLMLVVMVIVFLVCQTPMFVNHVLYAMEGRVELGPNHRYYNVITNCLLTFNSATNFFIYLVFVNGFLKRWKGLLSFWRQKARRGTCNLCVRASTSVECTSVHGSRKPTFFVALEDITPVRKTPVHRVDSTCT